MTQQLSQLKQEFGQGLSQISHFWGFPKGMGAIFAVLYTSSEALSLDTLVEETGLTKGAISTNVRALARLGLVRRSTRLGDRKDYYEAETDFYQAIRGILKERQNTEFDNAVRSVQATLEKLESGPGPDDDPREWAFMQERVQALQAFFDALDRLVRAVSRLESLGITTIEKILGVLK